MLVGLSGEVSVSLWSGVCAPVVRLVGPIGQIVGANGQDGRTQWPG